MQENCLEDFLRMLAGMSSGEEEREESEPQEDDSENLGPFPKIKQACILLLNWKRCKIREKERRMAALGAERDEEIKEHNGLVDELKLLDARFAATAPMSGAPPMTNSEVVDEPKSPEQAGDAPQPETPPEEGEHEDERQGADAQPESQLKLDGISRLERLQAGLDHALEVLSGSKMAFHFKAIMQLRLDLIELSNANGKSEADRIAELEAGLKHAVEVLSTSPNAANSKTMRQLWGDLILVLKPESQMKQ